MASLKDIKRKVGAVQKTKQITRAMNMVAASKFKSSQVRMENFRPYAGKFMDVLNSLALRVNTMSHPLLAVRDPKKIRVVCMTSDRGLCGGFNTNLIKATERFLKDKSSEGKEISLLSVGRKGRDYFRKKANIIGQWVDILSKFDMTLSVSISDDVIAPFIKEEYDELYLIYNQFVNVDVRRAAGDPDQNFRNVFSGQRVHAGINLFGGSRVALETHQRKFRFRQPRIHRADADARADQFQPQRAGRAINRATLVSRVAGDRADIDDACPRVARHERQRRARHPQHAEHVRLDHRLPIGVLAFGDRVNAMRAAGVVDQNVKLSAIRLPPSDFFPRPRNKFFDAGRFRDIKKMKMRLACPGLFHFHGDCFQAVNAPRAQQQFCAGRAKRARRRRAETGRCAGDENPFVFER